MDGDSGLQRLRKGVYQSIILVVFGVVIGAGFNTLNPQGIPWVGEWPQEAGAVISYDGLQPISVEEAKMFHEAGVALFLDVRGYDASQRSHLPGARNIPMEEAENRISEIREMADAGMIVITYCHGVGCALAARLAQVLKAHGVPSVRPLVSGWSDWVNAGYPVEGGGA